MSATKWWKVGVRSMISTLPLRLSWRRIALYSAGSVKSRSTRPARLRHQHHAGGIERGQHLVAFFNQLFQGIKQFAPADRPLDPLVRQLEFGRTYQQRRADV